MYPHDALPDEACEEVVRAVEAEASGNEDVRAAIAQGIAAPDDPTPFGEREADAQLQARREAEGTPFGDPGGAVPGLDDAPQSEQPQPATS